MNEVLVSLDATSEKKAAREFSLAIIGGLYRFAELCVIALVGASVHLAYVYPEQGVVSIRYISAIAIAVLVSGALFQWLGVYRGDYLFAKRLRADRMLLAWACAFGILLTFAFALKISSSFSRVWAVTWFVTTAGVLTLCRIALDHLILHWAREGRFANRTVIFAIGDQGKRLAAYLNQHGDVRTRIIGFIDDRKTRVQSQSEGYNLLGDTETLIRLIHRNLVDQVFIALPWYAGARIRELVSTLATTPVCIRLAPDLAGFEFPDRQLIQISGIPMLEIFERPISGWPYIIKRTEDLVLGSLFLLFLTPLMLLIAVAIKVDTPGPVFFKQNRHGFNNQLIYVWKFRTMDTSMMDPECEVQVTKNDPRITSVGSSLRRSSLDELPQLFNVLKGDMSIVGPRPHALGTKAEGRLFWEVVDRYVARHRVKPGITGWAQVNGWRGETNTIEKIRKRVEHDLYYIDNWSLWLDLWIIVKTAFVLFRDENAY